MSHSFIDMMADHDWSDADITRRTEAMVRSEFSAEAETILNRKQWAIAVGQITDPAVVAAVQSEAAQFAAVTLAAQMAGVQARADMALLRQALGVEDAQARLALLDADEPEPYGDGPVPDNADEIEQWSAARAAAWLLVNNTTSEVLALVAERASYRTDHESLPEGGDA
jgi:hypothetical protein